jgi:hypothetical protein
VTTRLALVSKCSSACVGVGFDVPVIRWSKVALK